MEYLDKAVGGLFVAFLMLMGNLMLEKMRRSALEKRVEKLEKQEREKCNDSSK